MTPERGQGAVIVPFTGCDSKMSQRAPHYPLLNEVEAYWDALREGRNVPMRSDIDPRGLERALDNTFMLERQPGALARVRLSGWLLNTLLGMDLRGMPLHALFAPEDRAAFDQMIEQVFAAPQVLRLNLRAADHGGLSGAMLVLPLRDDFGQINRAMGVLQVNGELAPTPCRLAITGHQPRPLPRRGTTSHAADATDQQGFAEFRARYSIKKGPDASRPALRLVKSEP